MPLAEFQQDIHLHIGQAVGCRQGYMVMPTAAMLAVVMVMLVLVMVGTTTAVLAVLMVVFMLVMVGTAAAVLVMVFVVVMAGTTSAVFVVLLQIKYRLPAMGHWV